MAHIVYANLGTVSVEPGLPDKVLSTVASGANLILFGNVAEIMDAITSGSIMLVNSVSAI